MTGDRRGGQERSRGGGQEGRRGGAALGDTSTRAMVAASGHRGRGRDARDREKTQGVGEWGDRKVAHHTDLHLGEPSDNYRGCTLIPVYTKAVPMLDETWHLRS